MLSQVIGKCFELDKKSLIEPMLNVWISVVSLAGCATGSFKTDFGQVHEMNITNGEAHGAAFIDDRPTVHSQYCCYVIVIVNLYNCHQKYHLYTC